MRRWLTRRCAPEQDFCRRRKRWLLMSVRAIFDACCCRPADRHVRLESLTYEERRRCGWSLPPMDLGIRACGEFPSLHARLPAERGSDCRLPSRRCPPRAWPARSIWRFRGAAMSDWFALRRGAAIWPRPSIRPYCAAESPRAAVAAILAKAGLELPDVSNDERWLGTLPLTQHSRRLSAERIVLLGDAAGYVEPFTGEGIGWALASAATAAPWIARNLDCWDARSIGRWEILQRRQMVHGQAICRLIAGLLRKPLAVRMALGALAVAPSLANPFVRRVYRPTECTS